MVSGFVPFPIQPCCLPSTVEPHLIDREREKKRRLAVLSIPVWLPDLAIVDGSSALAVFQREMRAEPIADGPLSAVERLAVSVAVDEL